MRLLPAIIPAAAGAVFFAWAFISTPGDIPGCDGVPYEDAVDSWAAVGVFIALLMGVIGAAILARRLHDWLALVATAATRSPSPSAHRPATPSACTWPSASGMRVRR